MVDSFSPVYQTMLMNPDEHCSRINRNFSSLEWSTPLIINLKYFVVPSTFAIPFYKVEFPPENWTSSTSILSLSFEGLICWSYCS